MTIGSELEVVPDMLLTGAFAHINNVMFDWHTKKGDMERNELLKKLKVQLLKIVFWIGQRTLLLDFINLDYLGLRVLEKLYI